MRTPLAQWEKQAKKFDQQSWDAAQGILALLFQRAGNRPVSLLVLAVLGYAKL